MLVELKPVVKFLCVLSHQVQNLPTNSIIFHLRKYLSATFMVVKIYVFIAMGKLVDVEAYPPNIILIQPLYYPLKIRFKILMRHQILAKL